MELLAFLGTVFVISLSGALQPGPVTATAIMMGVRNRWAGTLMSIGHGLIEFPLMVLIMLPLGEILQRQPVKIAVGSVGGAVLLLMAAGMWKSASAHGADAQTRTHNPILAGAILTVSNPYFLLWWATVGLTLATKASGWGRWAFALFGLTHWLTDFIWLHALSWTSFKGSRVFSPKIQQRVLQFCALAILGFGVYFLIDAGRLFFASQGGA
jgi:threonine/homoserine/homoserine lactone efflux protein